MKKDMFIRLLRVILCWVVILAIVEYFIALVLFYMFSVAEYIIADDWLDDDDFQSYFNNKWPINRIILWLYP